MNWKKRRIWELDESELEPLEEMAEEPVAEAPVSGGISLEEQMRQLEGAEPLPQVL